MKKTKPVTKLTLLSSVAALLLCFAMLLGTTYAWFTDSVTSSGNIIKTGKLDIDLLVMGGNTGFSQYTSVKQSHDPIFNYQKWEPGYTLWTNAKVTTTGNLALKYTLRFAGENLAAAKLAEVIDVYYAASEITKPTDARPNLDNVAGLTKLGTLKTVFEQGDAVIMNGQMIPGEAVNGVTGEQFATIVLQMQKDAGNDYQNIQIPTFDLMLVATQLESESDSFDIHYDHDAVYPEVAVVTVPAGGAASSVSAGGVTVALPANTETDDQVYTLDVSDTNTTTNENNAISVEFDATLYLNGTRVTSDNNENIYPLTLTIPAGANITSVTHNGTALTNANPGEDQTYTYDPATGVLTIYTKSFSPFAVTYTVPVLVTGIVLDQSTLEVEMGTTATLTATVSPENADDPTVTWSSSNEAVATVVDGDVTGVFPGTATITASAGGKTATCTVTVYKDYEQSAGVPRLNYVFDTVGCSTGSAFLPIVAVNPEINKFSYTDETGALITNKVHFRFTRVEKIIDGNTYKIIVNLEIRDADGKPLVLQPGNHNTVIPSNGFEYLKVVMNTIEVPAGYSFSGITVNGVALTLTANSGGNAGLGEYWLGSDPKDVYFNCQSAGLIEITYTKTN